MRHNYAVAHDRVVSFWGLIYLGAPSKVNARASYLSSAKHLHFVSLSRVTLAELLILEGHGAKISYR